MMVEEVEWNDMELKRFFLVCSGTFAADFQHKSSLKKKLQNVFEGIDKAGSPAPLREIYMELLVTHGEAEAPNEEHEVRWMETASRRAGGLETTMRCEDLFQAPPERAEPDRTALTKGVAGIGKTILTQKFILDRSEDKSHQNVQLLLPFTFRELNVLRDRKFSLVELLHHFRRPSWGCCQCSELCECRSRGSSESASSELLRPPFCAPQAELLQPHSEEL